jgi:hypothetical protein
MSTAQSSHLIAEIDNLLSRPLGSAAHVLPDEVIQRREQLKQLRFQLKNARDPRIMRKLEQECRLLISQLGGQSERTLQPDPQVGSLRQGDRDLQLHNVQPDLNTPPQSEGGGQLDPRRQSDLESPNLIALPLSPPTSSSPPPENGNIVNEIFDNAMLENDEQIATIRQTVRQAIEQTLAVERALTIAEINSNIKNLVEAQRRAAISTELQALERQKQALQVEIAKLESHRQEQIQQLSNQQQDAIAQLTQQQQAQIDRFSEQQKLYQAEIGSSIAALQELVRDRIPGEIKEVIREIRTAEASSLPDASATHQKFMEGLQQQTDRFATNLDAMFASAFESLEQNIQSYRNSLAAQLAQIQDYEQKHETLLANLAERMSTQVEALPDNSSSQHVTAPLSEIMPEPLRDRVDDVGQADALDVTNASNAAEESDDRENYVNSAEIENLIAGLDSLVGTPGLPEQSEEIVSEDVSGSRPDTLSTTEDDLIAITDADSSKTDLSIFDEFEEVAETDLESESETEVTEAEIADLAEAGDRSNLAIMEQVRESEEIERAVDSTDIATDAITATAIDTNIDTDTNKLTNELEVAASSRDETLEDGDVEESDRLGQQNVNHQIGRSTDRAVEDRVEESNLDLNANPEFDELMRCIESDFSQDLNKIVRYVRPGEETMVSQNTTENTTEMDAAISANLAPEVNLAIADLTNAPPTVSSMDEEFDRMLNAVVEKKSLREDEVDPRQSEPQVLEDLQPEELSVSDEEAKLSELADAESPEPEIVHSDSNLLAKANLADNAVSVAPINPDKLSFGSPPDDVVDPSYSMDDTWFLGIDFGSESLRASLFNATTGKIYPLLFDVGSGASSDRLASIGSYSSDPKISDPLQASIDMTSNLERNDEKAIAHFQHLLKLGLPYCGVSSWQPIVEWTKQQRIPLRYFQAILKQLLLRVQTSAICGKLPDLHTIMSKRIYAVILGHPTAWPDTYVHNLREAVLATDIVNQAEQVMVIDRAIAPLFALIHQSKAPQDTALIIDIGAQTTDILLVKPANGAIGRSNLSSRGFDYAGLGINQDIVVQLLYPHWRSLTNPERDACNLDRLLMPAPGDPALRLRAELQKYLIGSSVGRELLHAADRLKLELSTDLERDRWVTTVCDQPLTVWRRELETQVIQPFIQHLNRELNDLLSSSGILSDEVKSVWKLGGTSTLPSLSRWFEQKLPNATIDRLPASTVASGLAIAPMYRYLINISRQQYSDYFLLQEICRLNLQSAVTPNQLMQQLQNRGVNSKSCRDRILTLLQGDLPMGLFPWQEQEQSIFLTDPGISSDLFAGRLFELETNGTYQPNLRKFQLLRTYLQAILGNMQQSLSEPLLFPEFGRITIG